MHRRTYLPVVENTNACTPRDLIPLTVTIFGRGVNKAFDLVLWILNLDVRQFADVVRVSADLRLHSLELFDKSKPPMTYSMTDNYLSWTTANQST